MSLIRRTLTRLLRPLLPRDPALREEDSAVDLLMRTGDPAPLVRVMRARPADRPFRLDGARDYYSPTGRIWVCHDIYGYETRIDGGRFLDVAPESYGLTREEGRELELAILSNVPGSTAYGEKLAAVKKLSEVAAFIRGTPDDETLLRDLKQEAENGLVIGDETGMREALETILAKCDRRLGIVPLERCAAGRDGDCSHARCPQIRDGEPAKSRRHCPLDRGEPE